jgi:hypothetical protein
MHIYKNAEIAAAWITMHTHRNDSVEYNDNFFAYELLDSLAETDCERAWLIINNIFSLNKDDIIIANLAAGPFEKLLSLHGPAIISRIEEKAASDETFRKMLGAIWQNGMTDEIWARVKAVAGPSW